MKIKKNLIISIIFLLLFGLMGCDNNEHKEEAPLKKLTELPTYGENELDMWIGGWNDPRPTDTAYKDLHDAGFNFLFVWDGKGETAFNNVIEYASKYDINILYYTRSQKVSDHNDYSFIKNHLNNDNLYGFMYFDEPKEQKIQEFIPVVADHNKNYPEKLFYINLLSSVYYVGSSNYESYLRAYLDTVTANLTSERVLSVDLYPLEGLPERGAVSPSWLYNLESTQKLSKEYDAYTHYFVTATKHHNYRRITEETLRYEIAVLMSYGVRGFTYFTYANDAYSDFEMGIVSIDGSIKTEKYDWVKKINLETRQWEDVYLSFDYQETMLVLGEGNRSNQAFKATRYDVENIAYIKDIAATADTIVSSFIDENGNYGTYLVNFSDPDLNETATIDLTFKGANKAIVYYQGERTVIDLVDGKFSYVLTPGQSVFVIPVNLQE